MNRQPTIVDVALEAGVSRQTVSNVLNTPTMVREDTRHRVEAAIERLGYRTHASARRLRTQRSSTIGVRLEPSTNGVSGALLDRFLHTLTEQAEGQGLRVVLYTARDAEHEIAQFSRLIDGADIDGLILTSTFYGDPRTEWLVAHNQRFVTFGRPWGISDLEDPQHFWVDVDGRAGVRQATEHLLAEGAKTVAFLGWPRGSGTGDERRHGWEQALTDAGIPEDARLEAETVESIPAARAAAVRLLNAHPEIDALVAVSDTAALGALIASDGALPVVGFDNTAVAESIGFSSVDQRLDVVAGDILRLLNEVGTTSSAHPDAHTLVTPRLVTRPRTGALELLRRP
ncbi:LacI family DNA-binding transcriptional regulator [Gryllotalpicola reticulitermitis]|uniref:LacI family DNA-binding transcriptional regulator n=1 Tax=Gryllotalpicola reticulitermitis TaxID=1184153 RepID=A0ABV8Q8H3_9MICO